MHRKQHIFMKNSKPFILISNDDGYQAKGIRSLVDMLSPIADILVCAPDSARSGFSCAFSANNPLRLELKSKTDNVQVWSCNGTPVDCVKIALSELCNGRTPDLVLGGINHGDNASVNSHYSGTMGVAMEGCMKYIPSMALSLCDHREDADFSPMAPIIKRLVAIILDKGLPRGVCLNVNAPAVPEYKGIKVCRMAYGRWKNEIVRCHHQRGFDYYWMVGAYETDEHDAEDTDHWVVDQGYVAITPTSMDVSSYEMIEQMKDWNL